MWVSFHTNRNQPDGTRTLIIPCADGEVETREIARSYCYEWQSWGLTCVVCLCHSKEDGCPGVSSGPCWLIPSLSHKASLSLRCGANDPELSDLLLSGEVSGLSLADWEGLREGHAQGCHPVFFVCWFARLSPAWSVQVCVRLHMSLHRGRKWGSSTTARLSQGCIDSRDPGSEVCSWWT